jgi:hypothetical protein
MAKFKEYEDRKPALMIKAALDIIHEPGEVFEVRVPKTKYGTISGYFDDTTLAASLIARENGKHQAIYMTVNPVQSALIARNANRLEHGSQTTSTDADIAKRRWFLIDLDPKRPTGISSTDGELARAEQMAVMIVEWLSSMGWPEPMIALSGNGVHLMFRTDDPNDDAARTDYECALKMLSSVFSDDYVVVDTTAFNAARVWKVYGTISAKGSSTEERPHRVAKITKLPKEFEILSRDKISAMAAPIRDAKTDEFKDMSGEYIADMVKWLADRGQTVVSGPRPMFGSEGQKWEISRCPFNHNHSKPIVALVGNRPVFKCLHNSCQQFRWKEYREKIDPTYKDPETIERRLKEWCGSGQEEIDRELAQSACTLGKGLQAVLSRVKKEVPRPRYLLLEDHLKLERRQFIKDTIGENNEKGNIVGVINRVRHYQREGAAPMYWIADYDHKIRVGPVGDVDCPLKAEEDEIALMVRFHSSGDTWVKQTHCAQAIMFLAQEYKVNPLKIHLKKKTWDGTPRLGSWLIEYMGTKDTEYTRAVGRKWIISAVARAMEPGCQADHMLILEGTQGIGKSQALRALGGQFYVEYSNSFSQHATNHKDMVAAITGKMIIEMSELATLKRGDMESLKAVLTTTADEARLAYDRNSRMYPRTCIFGGTTNEVGQSYIADATGARRFWPVHCGEVRAPRIAALREIVDQLWAEAVEAYEAGEDWWEVPKELVAEEQTARQITIEDSEPWFGKIRASLTDPDSYANEYFYCVEGFEKGQPTGTFVVRAGAIHKMMTGILGIDASRMSQYDVARIQKVLRSIGFKKTRPSRGWLDSTYAYDLTREVVPHLWDAIKTARDSVKFPRSEKEKQK